MTRSLLTQRSRWGAGVVVASLTAATVVMPAGTALAAVANPAATGIALASGQANPVYTTTGVVSIDYTLTPGSFTTAPEVHYVYVAGPSTAGSLSESDGQCAGDPCDITLPDLTPGSNTIRLFADNNDDSIITAGEPTVDVQVVVSGSVESIQLVPSGPSASTGAEVTYQATARDGNNNLVPNAVLELLLTQAGSSAPTLADVTSSAAPTGTGTAGDPFVVTGTDTTGANGQPAEFKVTGTAAGNILVRVYEDRGPAGFDGGDPSASTTQTVVAGGAPGVTSISASPASDTQYVNVQQTINVKLTGANNVPIAGVTPSVDITAGPNAAINPTCGSTNAAGETTCTYTGTAAGNDTVVIWVNQVQAVTTSGPDAGEPVASVSRTVAALPQNVDTEASNPADTTSVDCVTQEMGDDQGKFVDFCVVPVDQKTVAVQAVVKNTSGAPIPGVVVSWSSTGLATGDSITPSSVTDAAGVATATLTIAGTPATAGSPDYTVTAMVGTTITLGTARVDYQVRNVEIQAVTPETQVAQFGGSVTVMALLADQFGKPAAANTDVTFSVTGRNAESNTIEKTNAAGIATYTYRDNSVSTTDGQYDNIWVNGGVEAYAYWYANATPATIVFDVNDDTNGYDDFAAGDDKGVADYLEEEDVLVKVLNSQGVPLDGVAVALTASAGEWTGSDDGGPISADGKTLITTTGSHDDGEAHGYLESTVSGPVTITAVAGGVTTTATIVWGNPDVTDARWITTEPADKDVTIPPGTIRNVGFKVTDQYGNAVPNVAVNFTNAGSGYFVGGTNFASAVSNSNGVVTVAVTSLSTATGTSTVTAAIAPDADPFTGGIQTTNCSAPASGSLAAGKCSDTAEVTWGVEPVVTGTVWRNGPGLVTLNVTVSPNAEVKLYQGQEATGDALQTKTADASGKVQFLVPNVQKSMYLTVEADGLTKTRFINIHIGTYMTLSSPAAGKVHARMDISPKAAGQEVRFWRYFPNGSRVLLGKAFTNANGVAQGTFNAPTGANITVRAFVISKLDGLTNGFTKFKTVRIK